jgi:protoporphyrinogen oxidase
MENKSNSIEVGAKGQKAVIVGAGPAGLTAAYELVTRTGIQPTILEKSEYMGGISRTVNYKGNRIDIGGHRFFSKSDRVMQWWLRILPMQSVSNGDQTVTYRQMRRHVDASASGPNPAATDKVMLLRPRKSRIYCLRSFFDYPISLSKDTLMKLGLLRTLKIGISYMKVAVFPIRNEANLEQFFINRFGRELYLTFFKSYTEKVWGIACDQISAEWGAQRIRGLSVWKALSHAFRKVLDSQPQNDIRQKNTETSLIEQFLYPKLGPGQMWEEIGRQVQDRGGRILTGYTVDGFITNGTRVQSVRARNIATGQTEIFEGDHFFSTMPVRDLVESLDSIPPDNVREVAKNLVYRDFITVGLLVNQLKISDRTPQGKKLISDNWIYIQEPDVLMGRLQIFNNWSPYMVSDPSKVWLGLEYFCNETDALWKMPDADLIALGSEELSKIGIIEQGEMLDGTVLRMEKTYPAYFGSYGRFGEIRSYTDRFENLFLVGRNGMHKYNNQDHSMLTAMIAVDNIIGGVTSKDNLWEVNTEMDYHEEKDAKR